MVDVWTDLLMTLENWTIIACSRLNFFSCHREEYPLLLNLLGEGSVFSFPLRSWELMVTKANRLSHPVGDGGMIHVLLSWWSVALPNKIHGATQFNCA